ncbi:glutamate-rich protein 1 isoform X2 [Diceros bicornis minor]|uniref:glutamate-rich protein 1 isoform X2 n=1 Tax=Diceros bicornis minor TaxID=77932 RepID=UPI0026ED35BD|nr:glutamate-rich protein 1 isoform X2 [Diceros bicornis minor]
MAAPRRRVFVEKVLKRLFPEVPHGQEKRAPVPAASEKPAENVAHEQVKGQGVPPFTGGDTQTQPERRLYTVSLPPEGYVPALPEPHSCTDAENSASSDGTGDQDPHDQPKRRRIRKHKSKKKFKILNNVHVEQAELEKQESLLQEKSQPWHTDGPTISKNKKRKLKKKQQIRRKKAAGLLTKASGVNFMYQPEESNSEQEDVRESSGEEVPAASEEGATEANEEDVRDASEEGATDAKGEDGKGTKEEGVTCAEEEDVKSTNEKADSILNFLKSTEEIYFYDGFSKDSDPAVFMETTEELFKHLETHSLSPSDVFILDHMKTLLLSQDTERLKSALELFPEHCMMPPECEGILGPEV